MSDPLMIVCNGASDYVVGFRPNVDAIERFAAAELPRYLPGMAGT